MSPIDYGDFTDFLWGEDGDLLWHDPREAVEALLESNPDQWVSTLAALRQRLAGVEDEHTAGGRLRHVVGMIAPPEGTSWLRWAAWYEHRLEEAIADPTTVLSQGTLNTSTRKHRKAAWVEGADRDAAAQAVVEQHRDEVAEWSARQNGSRRLHLVGSVGAGVGQLEVLRQVRDPPVPPEVIEASAPSERFALRVRPWRTVVDRTPTDRLAVVLERTDNGHGVLGAHPAEVSTGAGDTGARTRWPVLRSILGGYFHHGFHGPAWTVEYAWHAQETCLHSEPGEVLHQAAGEIDQVLRLPDPELVATLDAFGFYLTPPSPRLWLEWMAWRIRSFDWKGPIVNPDEPLSPDGTPTHW